MILDPTIDLDKESYGQLMSLHSAGAIAGKFATGIAADKLGGRRMFLLALALTAAANLGFAFCSSFVLMGALNFFGQFVKSGGWPAMTKIVGAWYPPDRYGRVWSIISTSSRVGTICAGLLLGFLLTFVGWRIVFGVTAVVTFAIVAAAYFLLYDSPEDKNLPPIEHDSNESSDDQEEHKPHPLDAKSLGQACVHFAASPRFWLIGFSLFFLCILMDFINFIPIYLTETIFGPEATEENGSLGGMASAAFPAGMFAALIATGFLYDRLSKFKLIFTLGGLLVAANACVILLWNVAKLPQEANTKLYIAMAEIFVLGFVISPAYYIPMSIFSISFGGRHAGFLVATIDIFGYIGALLFNFFGGTIAEDYGWPVFLGGLLAVTVAATACMTAFLALDWRASTKAAIA